MRYLKQFFKVLFIAIIVLIACYFFQPLKKGKGSDETIKYEQVDNWLQLPAHIILGNPTGIDIDTNGNIVIFHRAERTWPLFRSIPQTKIKGKTILIIDRNTGNLIDSWGNDLFSMPHGLTIDHANNIWVTDVGSNQVFKFNSKGELLMKLGVENETGKDAFHFNKPTDIAVTRDGSFYVSDGYGNNRIVKFSSSGKCLFEWGRKGDDAGAFHTPHGIDVDDKGNVYVADRENDRIQVFDPSGKFLRMHGSKNIGSICAVSVKEHGRKIYAVDDVSFLKLKHRGSDVLLFDSTGNIRARLGRSGSYKEATSWYHDICVDADENIYVGDILNNTVQKFRKQKN
jgi:peptidylamidoglycolate lyase